MATLPINQDVSVRWRHPDPVRPDEAAGAEVVRTFDNLIPACEFALAMVREGDTMVSVLPTYGPALSIDQAQQIASAWETGKIALDATEVEI